MDEKLYYLGFSLFPGIGPAIFGKLLNEFGSAKAAWESPKKDFMQVAGEKLTEKFFAFKKTIYLEKEFEKCVQKKIQLVTFEDKEYPAILRELKEKPSTNLGNNFSPEQNKVESKGNRFIPFLLYVKGNVSVLSAAKIICIVGTRKITPYGRQVTEMLTKDLVNAGFVTVSGLALGVDAVVHKVTVENKGKTIAVLGCGVDCCFPRENQKIYDEILASGGVIVSTFSPGMEATKGSFPARNRIVAGLSQAVLVTEGAEDSGALITANYAKQFSRPIFAVPGPITSNLSKGANSLLKDGAIAVTDARDIISTLKPVIPDLIGDMDSRFRGNEKKRLHGDTEEEQKVLELLQFGPLHFDEIVRTIGKDSKTIGSLLSLLELKEMVKSSADGKYFLS